MKNDDLPYQNYKNNSNDVDPSVVYSMNMFISFVIFLIPFLYILSLKDVHVFIQYLISINITTVVMFGFDKYKAIRGTFRVPEATLHTLEVLGGAPGAFISMLFFNHKISKLSFLKITWIIAVIQVTIVFFPKIISLNQNAQLMIFVIVVTVILMLIYIENIIAGLEWIGSILQIIMVVVIILVFLSSILIWLFKSDDSNIVENTELNINKEFLQVKKSDIGNSIERRQSSICRDYYVNVKSLNIRAKATTNSNIVDKFSQNEKICISKIKNSWAYVDNKGWVYRKFIKKK